MMETPLLKRRSIAYKLKNRKHEAKAKKKSLRITMVGQLLSLKLMQLFG